MTKGGGARVPPSRGRRFTPPAVSTAARLGSGAAGAGSEGADGDDRTAAQRALAAVCPHLVAENGGWRAASPLREHRCTAVRPPAPVSQDTQRRLCLAERHVTCPHFVAALQRRAAGLATDGIPSQHLDSFRLPPAGGVVPLALERPSGISRAAPGIGPHTRVMLRRVALPLGLVAVVAAIVVAAAAQSGGRTSDRPSTIPGGLASPSVAPTPGATTPPSATSLAGDTGARPSASAPAQVSPRPTSGASQRTYRVKRGDSLSRIAKRFGTTVAAIKALNGIADPPRIRLGQTLRIPEP